MLRRFTNIAACTAAAGPATAVLGGCGGASTPRVGGSSPLPNRPGKVADPQLRALERHANRLLDGGADAFEVRLKRLRRHPVVVNQWASWCGPCRYEFPFVQQLAAQYRGRVAFLGVNSHDSEGDAEDFLDEFPVPFPHSSDRDASVARLFGGGRAWPTTAFYGADGELVKTHLGAYASQAKLEEDIRRYALDG